MRQVSVILLITASHVSHAGIEDDDEAFKEKIKKLSGFRTFRPRFEKRIYDNGKEKSNYFKVKK